MIWNKKHTQIQEVAIFQYDCFGLDYHDRLEEKYYKRFKNKLEGFYHMQSAFDDLMFMWILKDELYIDLEDKNG